MGRGLPRKYAKMGFSKGWKEYKKTLNRTTTKRKVVRVKRMAKRRKRRYTRRTKYRRKKDKRISLIGTAGAVGSIFVPRRSGQMSMGSWLKAWLTGERRFDSKDVENFLGDTVGQYTGFDWRQGQTMFSIPWATVTVIATGLAAKIANRYGGKYLRNLPIVGNHVKF